MYCTSPVTIYRPDDIGRRRVKDPASGSPMWQLVPCSKCSACIANRKNDWTGRLNAEAMTAAAVYFVTLTYKEEPTEFRYRDVQLMLKRLRKAAAERNFSVRFFCVGERGNLKGRIHWHLLLFLDRPINIKAPAPGELWRFWDHGWTQIKRLSSSDMLRSIRYVSKYAIKSMGQDDKSCRMRCSMKPLMGAAFLDDYARKLATEGLPAKGSYTLPDTVYSTGRKAGSPIKFRLTHAAARRFAGVYMETWDARFPGRLYPYTSWLVRWSGTMAGFGPGPEQFDRKFCEMRYYPKGEHAREQAQARQTRRHDEDGVVIDPEERRQVARRRFFEWRANCRVEAIHDHFGDCREVEGEAHRIYDDAEAAIAGEASDYQPWTFGDFGSPQHEYRQFEYQTPADHGRVEVDPFEGHEAARFFCERLFSPYLVWDRAVADERTRQKFAAEFAAE